MCDNEYCIITLDVRRDSRGIPEIIKLQTTKIPIRMSMRRLTSINQPSRGRIVNSGGSPYFRWHPHAYIHRSVSRVRRACVSNTKGKSWAMTWGQWRCFDYASRGETEMRRTDIRGRDGGTLTLQTGHVLNASWGYDAVARNCERQVRAQVRLD